MTAADLDLWHRLSDPAGPHFISDQPDYYCAVTPLLALGERSVQAPQASQAPGSDVA